MQAGGREGALGVEDVKNIADTGLVAAQCDAFRLFGAGQQVGGGADRLRCGLQILPGIPYLERDLQAQGFALGAGCFSAGLRRA